MQTEQSHISGSTSTSEERERIREFWLQLEEEERRNLVRVEKDSMLQNMKEQRKHSCTCAFCDRKRDAINEELEVLYDSYYEELEQYTKSQQQLTQSKGKPPPLQPGPFPGSVQLDANGFVDLSSHENEREREKALAEVDNNVSESKSSGWFDFTKNLATAGPGNILIVADDLLKGNDTKFLDMMEQLAGTRMLRVEEAASASLDELESNLDDLDEPRRDKENSEINDDNVEEEKRKAEEGRRMFSIFAARMFEQRLLQSYREKVAQGRRVQARPNLKGETAGDHKTAPGEDYRQEGYTEYKWDVPKAADEYQSGADPKPEQQTPEKRAKEWRNEERSVPLATEEERAQATVSEIVDRIASSPHPRGDTQVPLDETSTPGAGGITAALTVADSNLAGNEINLEVVGRKNTYHTYLSVPYPSTVLLSNCLTYIATKLSSQPPIAVHAHFQTYICDLAAQRSTIDLRQLPVQPVVGLLAILLVLKHWVVGKGGGGGGGGY